MSTGPWSIASIVPPGTPGRSVEAVPLQVDPALLHVAGLLLAGSPDRPENRRMLVVGRWLEAAAKHRHEGLGLGALDHPDRDARALQGGQRFEELLPRELALMRMGRRGMGGTHVPLRFARRHVCSTIPLSQHGSSASGPARIACPCAGADVMTAASLGSPALAARTRGNRTLFSSWTCWCRSSSRAPTASSRVRWVRHTARLGWLRAAPRSGAARGAGRRGGLRGCGRTASPASCAASRGPPRGEARRAVGGGIVERFQRPADRVDIELAVVTGFRQRLRASAAVVEPESLEQRRSCGRAATKASRLMVGTIGVMVGALRGARVMSEPAFNDARGLLAVLLTR